MLRAKGLFTIYVMQIGEGGGYALVLRQGIKGRVKIGYAGDGVGQKSTKLTLSNYWMALKGHNPITKLV
jgi:hypothetical protein